ncbi:MAG: hypothetical protein ACR2GY_08840 [Phycisphaerales bacterium]
MLELFVEDLMLDDEAAALAAHLFTLHEERFAAFVTRGRAIESAIHKRIGETEIATLERWRLDLEREEKLAPLADEQARLDQAFLDDWKALTDPENSERWTAFRFRVNRLRWLGRLGGGGQVDLIAIVDALELRDKSIDPAQFSELLHEYAASLDAALVARNRFEIDVNRRLVRRLESEMATDGVNVWNAGIRDLRGVAKKHRERFELGEAIRSVNEAYRYRLQALLSAESIVVFGDACFWASLTGSWDCTNLFNKPGTQLLRSLEKRSAVSSEQRARFGELEEWYRRGLGSLGRALLEADREATLARADLLDSSGAIKHERRAREIRNEMYALEERLAELLWQELTEAQRKEIDRPAPVRFVDLDTGLLSSQPSGKR